MPEFLTRSLDPDWIDIEMLGYWLWKCDTEHREKCGRPLNLGPSILGRANLLIDIQRKCLVVAKTDHRYACLSYVWGSASTLKTGRDNLDSLMEENSIQSRWMELPRTIRDTISFVEQLGIPYLWIDALCIVQDDTVSKHDQIQAMAGIYANAYVTIIAGNGWDAGHGLRGIQGITEPRQLSAFLKYDLQENLQPYQSIWYSRGWTFQEMIFSPRKIMFQYQLAVWECSSASWNESSLTLHKSLADSHHLLGISPWQSRIKFSDWPDVQQYVALSYEYTRRKLTYGEDAFNAISSLFSVMSSSFSGGFISGLPAMFFDEALLWQPSEPMQTRQSPDKPESLPSWSWTSWEGELLVTQWLEYWSHLNLYRAESPCGKPVLQVSNLVTWFYGNTLEERLSVNNSGQTYIDALTNPSLTLPPRWSKMNGKSVLDPIYVFDGRPKTGSSYPLPTISSENTCLIIARYLFCRTTRGHFDIDRVSSTSGLGLSRILDNTGKMIGQLNLFLVEPIERIPKHCKVELVAVSTGVLRLKSTGHVYLSKGGSSIDLKDDIDMGWTGLSEQPQDAGHSVLYPRGIHLVDFYYVLWIKWIDGIAYRKGLGRVLKEAWERQAAEEIDLVLG